MGLSYSPAHVIYFTYADGHKDVGALPAWNLKDHGCVSDENLAKVVRKWNEAFSVGGVNYYSGPPIVIVAAKVVSQRTSRVKAEWVDYNHKAKVACEARRLEKARAG